MLMGLWTWLVVSWLDASSALSAPTLPDYGGDPPPDGPPPR